MKGFFSFTLLLLDLLINSVLLNPSEYHANNFNMPFHHSAEDIRIDDGHVLRARLQRVDGEWNDAEIDLNNHIGNIDGT